MPDRPSLVAPDRLSDSDSSPAVTISGELGALRERSPPTLGSFRCCRERNTPDQFEHRVEWFDRGWHATDRKRRCSSGGPAVDKKHIALGPLPARRIVISGSFRRGKRTSNAKLEQLTPSLASVRRCTFGTCIPIKRVALGAGVSRAAEHREADRRHEAPTTAAAAPRSCRADDRSSRPPLWRPVARTRRAPAARGPAPPPPAPGGTSVARGPAA